MIMELCRVFRTADNYSSALKGANFCSKFAPTGLKKGVDS